MDVRYLLMPVIGGLIGWITNALAIWMLFHPYKEKKILGMKVPFTPGLIPSRMKDLAASVASAVKDYIFTAEEVEKLLKELKLDDLVAHELTKNLPSPLDNWSRALATKLFKEKLANIGRDLSGEMRKEVEERLEELVLNRILDNFDPQKVEVVVRRVASRELRYITLFGGLLGALIGAVQALWMMM